MTAQTADTCECGRPQGECVRGELEHCDAEFDLPFICPVTGNPCLTEHDEFCEDYGCARKAGIDVDREWT